MVEKKKQALKKKKKRKGKKKIKHSVYKRKGKETVQINTTWKKSSNLLKLTLFKMCCVYSFFLKKATVCSENMEKHDIYIYIYHLKQTVNVIKSSP